MTTAQTETKAAEILQLRDEYVANVRGIRETMLLVGDVLADALEAGALQGGGLSREIRKWLAGELPDQQRKKSQEYLGGIQTRPTEDAAIGALKRLLAEAGRDPGNLFGKDHPDGNPAYIDGLELLAAWLDGGQRDDEKGKARKKIPTAKITPAQELVLRAIDKICKDDELGRCTQSEVVVETSKAKSTISTHLKALVDCGCIERDDDFLGLTGVGENTLAALN